MAKKIFSLFVLGCFFLYLGLLFYMLFRGFGRGNALPVNAAYNLIPFRTIAGDFTSALKGYGYALRNLGGNLFLLSPLGFFLPFFSSKLGKENIYILVVTLSITLIEIAQYLSGAGRFDVDDIILNVTGAMIGLPVCKFTPIRRLFPYSVS